MLFSVYGDVKCKQTLEQMIPDILSFWQAKQTQNKQVVTSPFHILRHKGASQGNSFSRDFSFFQTVQ